VHCAFGLHYDSVHVYNELIVIRVVLILHAILGYDQIKGAVAPLGDGCFIGVFPLTHHEFDRIVFTIACKECDCFIAGPYGFELAVNVTFRFYQVVGVFEH